MPLKGHALGTVVEPAKIDTSTRARGFATPVVLDENGNEVVNTQVNIPSTAGEGEKDANE